MQSIPRNSIAKIVDYLWETELKHFEENMFDADIYLHGHIFFEIEKVKNWLEGRPQRND